MVLDTLKSSNRFNEFLTPSESFNPARFWSMIGTGVAIYVPTVFVMDKVWYSQFQRGKFHYFDDSGEWLGVDKFGHFTLAYIESNWCFTAMRWAGLTNRQATWVGLGASTVLQATVEIMDGFVDKYGFSWADMGSNLAGSGLFGFQQLIWKEQRILLKDSYSAVSYPSMPIEAVNGPQISSLKERASSLFGSSYSQSYLKDYNGKTYWLSVNPESFIKSNVFPKWLNIAFGYGAQNMFGGYSNAWLEDGALFKLSESDYPRYRQYYLSLDIDLTKIKTKSRLLRTLAQTFKFVKIPAPALEYNSLGKFKFHPFLF